MPRARDQAGETSSLLLLRVRLCISNACSDVLAIFLACLIGNTLHSHYPLEGSTVHLFALLLPIYIGIAINNDAFGNEVLSDFRLGCSRSVLAFIYALGLILFLSYYAKTPVSLSRVASAITLLSGTGLLVFSRISLFFIVRHTTGLRLTNDLLIVDGVVVEVPKGMRVLDTRRDNLLPDARDPHMLHRLGKCLEHVDRVVIACRPERRAIWAILLKGSAVDGHILAEEFDSLGAVGSGSFAGRPTLAVAHAPLDLSRRVSKRTLDLALTIPTLVFLAPLLLLIALVIKMDSPGQVFFCQPRVGRGNRIFSVYKFRSMHSDRADAAGDRSTTKDDDRVTRVGRVIRATSIDELPQLINVLRGEMSLVGPRPHALGSLAGKKLFWDVDERYWHRHACKPGLTGLAQVRGYRGKTREQNDLAKRLNADLEYVNGWTIWRDLSILARTVSVVVHKNSY